jgi:hypothetical protein
MDDVVVGPLELAAQRAAEGVDARADRPVRHRDAQESRSGEALDVRLIAAPDDQDVDRVMAREGANDVAELDADPVGTGGCTEAGNQDARHRLDSLVPESGITA